MHRLPRTRLIAVILFVGASVSAISVQLASATEPLAIAQTTSSISSTAFLGTPAPEVVTAPSSPSVDATSSASLKPVNLLSPAVGGLVLLVVLLAAGALLWRRRRMMGA